MSFRCHTITQNERHEEPKPFYFSRCLLIWLDRQLSLHSSDPAVPMRRPSVTRRDSQFGERHLMKSERESRESGLPCPSVGNVTIFHLKEYSNRRSSRSEAAQQSVDVPLRVPGFSAAGPCVFCQRTCGPRDFSVVGSEECLQVAPRLGALSSTRSEVGRWPHCVPEVLAPSVGVSP